MSLFKIKNTVTIGDLEFDLTPIPDDPDIAQIWPAGAVHDPGYLDKIDKEIEDAGGELTRWVWEKKFDGERLLLHFTSGLVRATTRRQTKKTGLMNEKTNNVPHLRCLYQPELEGTVIDGEIIYEGSLDTLGLTQSIMNSKPDRAIELQKQVGWVTFRAFDCLFYKGEDIRQLPWGHRRNYLNRVLDSVWKEFKVSDKYLRLSTAYTAEEYKDAFKRITSDGGEGLILKDIHSKYGESKSWIKVKNEEFVDAFVTGWEKGQGRNSEVCGYLKFSVWNEDRTEMIEIARVGALPDDIRRRVSENYSEFHLEVAELKAQEVTKFCRLRHPRIQRWRPDKGDAECSITRVQSLQKCSD